MRILALDSSGLVATVAILEDEQMIAEYTVNYKKTHSQTLLPMLDEIVKMTEFDLSTIDAIAVAGGPGSFTGLRIGAATAKGLGLALNKPLIHVPTVDGMAYGLFGYSGLICPIMDARRNQVYTGLYRFTEGEFQVVEEQMAISVSELIEKLNAYGEKVTFLGDGVPVYRNQFENGLTGEYAFAPAHLNRQRAAAVGALGMKYFQEGKVESARDHRPDYLRLSQAERERAEKDAERS
jgi:tRNA threonylcarbamoyladenosine biosynthesis protein TsaB